MTVDLAPHSFTSDERATAHAAFTWMLREGSEQALFHLRKLPPAALRDVALACEILSAAALKLAGVEDSLAPVPTGVEGHVIPGRRTVPSGQ